MTLGVTACTDHVVPIHVGHYIKDGSLSIVGPLVGLPFDDVPNKELKSEELGDHMLVI